MTAEFDSGKKNCDVATFPERKILLSLDPVSPFTKVALFFSCSFIFFTKTKNLKFGEIHETL